MCLRVYVCVLFVCMCVCVCVCVYVRAREREQARERVVCVCVFGSFKSRSANTITTHLHARTYAYTRAQARAHTRMHTHTHTRTHTRQHTHAHARMHTHIHTFPHTHTENLRFRKWGWWHGQAQQEECVARALRGWCHLGSAPYIGSLPCLFPVRVYTCICMWLRVCVWERESVREKEGREWTVCKSKVELVSMCTGEFFSNFESFRPYCIGGVHCIQGFEIYEGMCPCDALVQHASLRVEHFKMMAQHQYWTLKFQNDGIFHCQISKWWHITSIQFLDHIKNMTNVWGRSHTLNSSWRFQYNASDGI